MTTSPSEARPQLTDYRGRPRVVVTGLGAVTPLGRTAQDFWKNLVDGVSGIGPMTLCDTTNYPTKIAG